MMSVKDIYGHLHFRVNIYTEYINLYYFTFALYVPVIIY